MGFNGGGQPRYKNALIIAEQWKDLMSDEQKKVVSLLTNYKKNLVAKYRLFKCKEMYPETKYRKIRWKVMILLGTI